MADLTQAQQDQVKAAVAAYLPGQVIDDPGWQVGEDPAGKILNTNTGKTYLTDLCQQLGIDDDTKEAISTLFGDTQDALDDDDYGDTADEVKRYLLDEDSFDNEADINQMALEWYLKGIVDNDPAVIAARERNAGGDAALAAAIERDRQRAAALNQTTDDTPPEEEIEGSESDQRPTRQFVTPTQPNSPGTLRSYPGYAEKWVIMKMIINNLSQESYRRSLESNLTNLLKAGGAGHFRGWPQQIRDRMTKDIGAYQRGHHPEQLAAAAADTDNA